MEVSTKRFCGNSDSRGVFFQIGRGVTNVDHGIDTAAESWRCNSATLNAIVSAVEFVAVFADSLVVGAAADSWTGNRHWSAVVSQPGVQE